MRYQFNFEGHPIGFAASDYKEGEETEIILRDFRSSDDGEDFIRVINGMTSWLLSDPDLEAPIIPAQVNQLIAIIDSNNNVDMYINEPTLQSVVKVRRAVKAGQSMGAEDISDILELSFEGLEIGNDKSVVIVIPVGWKKVVFYDMEPTFQRDGVYIQRD